MNHNLRIATEKIAGHTAYFFRYRANEDMAFNCSMLCEVGQPFISSFEAIIKERGLDLVTMEINENPWVITVSRPAGVNQKVKHFPMGGWNPKRSRK